MLFAQSGRLSPPWAIVYTVGLSISRVAILEEERRDVPRIRLILNCQIECRKGEKSGSSPEQQIEQRDEGHEEMIVLVMVPMHRNQRKTRVPTPDTLCEKK